MLAKLLVEKLEFKVLARPNLNVNVYLRIGFTRIHMLELRSYLDQQCCEYRKVWLAGKFVSINTARVLTVLA